MNSKNITFNTFIKKPHLYIKNKGDRDIVKKLTLIDPSHFKYIYDNYNTYVKYKLLMREEDIYFSNYFSDSIDFKSYRVFIDRMNDVIFFSKVKKIKKILSFKRFEDEIKHNIIENIDYYIEKLIELNIPYSVIKNKIGSKIASFKKAADLESSLLNFINESFISNKESLFNIIEQRGLVENVDYSIDFNKGEHLVFDIKTYKAANSLGSVSWCINRSFNTFNDYYYDDAFSIKYSYDFNEENILNKIKAIILKSNNFIEDIYNSEDETYSKEENADLFNFFTLLYPEKNFYNLLLDLKNKIINYTESNLSYYDHKKNEFKLFNNYYIARFWNDSELFPVLNEKEFDLLKKDRLIPTSYNFSDYHKIFNNLASFDYINIADAFALANDINYFKVFNVKKIAFLEHFITEFLFNSDFKTLNLFYNQNKLFFKKAVIAQINKFEESLINSFIFKMLSNDLFIEYLENNNINDFCFEFLNKKDLNKLIHYSFFSKFKSSYIKNKIPANFKYNDRYLNLICQSNNLLFLNDINKNYLDKILSNKTTFDILIDNILFKNFEPASYKINIPQAIGTGRSIFSLSLLVKNIVLKREGNKKLLVNNDLIELMFDLDNENKINNNIKKLYVKGDLIHFFLSLDSFSKHIVKQSMLNQSFSFKFKEQYYTHNDITTRYIHLAKYDDKIIINEKMFNEYKDIFVLNNNNI